MAARLRKTHQDDIRVKIQVSNLIDRLEKHISGQISLENSQIKAIEILMKKALPDLAAIELSGDPDNPIGIQEVHRKIIDPCQS